MTPLLRLAIFAIIPAWFAVTGGAQAQNLFGQPSGQPPSSSWPPRFDGARPPSAEPPYGFFRAFEPYAIEGRWMVQGTKAVLLFERNSLKSSAIGSFWNATLLVDTLKHYAQGDVLLMNLRFNQAATVLQRQTNPNVIVFSGKILNAPEGPGERGVYGDCKVVLAGPGTLYVVMPGIAQTVPMHKLQ